MKDISLKAIAIDEKCNCHLVMAVNGKTVYKHRYVMELVLGRKLNFNEVVHHKNGIEGDNRVCNLTIMSRREHTAYHNHERMLESERESREWVKSLYL